MMHLLPSTIKKEKIEDADTEESSSYKKQKEARDKANSARYRGVLQQGQTTQPDKCEEHMWGLCRGSIDYQSQ